MVQKQQDLEARLTRLEMAGPSVPEAPLASSWSQATVPPPLPAELTKNPPQADPFPIVQSEFRPDDRATEQPVTPDLPRQSPAGWAEPALETKVGLTVANRVGVITLILGVAFFFKWAVDNEWIGPGGRVMLGVLAGFATLAAADFVWRKGQRIFAQGVTGTGIAILYLSIYAAYSFYALIPVGLAFALMFIATAMAVALALRYSSQAIAAFGLIGGYLTPLLLTTGEDRPWFYLSYLLVLNAGAMTLALKKSWWALEILGFGATVVLYGAWIFEGSNRVNDALPATLGALSYYALFSRASLWLLSLPAQFLAAMVMVLVWPHSPGAFFLFELLVAAGGLAYAEWRQKPVALSVAFASFWIAFANWNANWTDDPLPLLVGITAGFVLFLGWLFLTWSGWWSRIKRSPLTEQNMGVLALNGAVYYGFSYSLLNHDYHGWLGLLALAVSGGYLGAGAYLNRSSKAGERDLRPVLLSLGIALGFITLAIPIQFNGFTVTMAWCLEGAALTWIGARLESQRAQAGALLIFALAG